MTDEDRYDVDIEEFASRMAYYPGAAIIALYAAADHLSSGYFCPECGRGAREYLHKAWASGEPVALPGQRRTLEVMYFQYLAARVSVDPVAKIMGRIIFEEFPDARDLLDELILKYEEEAE